MLIVGLSGKKYAGKDSFYLELKKVGEERGIEVRRLALADPLKDEIYEYVLKPHNVERAALDDGRKVFFRLILQGWGTDFKRNMFGNDYWVRALEARLEGPDFKNFKGIVVITDVRFEDEAKFVRNCPRGLLVRIKRPVKGLLNKIKYTFGIGKDKHPSECALDNYDFDAIINNNKDLAHLGDLASEFFDELEDGEWIPSRI